MPRSISPEDAFSTWMQLRLVEDEADFDDQLLDACEHQLLTQQISSDLMATQVARVIKSALEDGEPNHGLVVNAMQRLIDYISQRDDGILAVPGLVAGGLAGRKRSRPVRQ